MKSIFSARWKGLLPLIVFTSAMSLVFQNCGEGFSLNDSSASSTTQLQPPSGDIPKSESDFYLKMYSRSLLAPAANLNQNCAIVTPLSPLPLVTHYPNVGDSQVPPVGSTNTREGTPNIDTSRFNLPTVGGFIGNSYSLSSYSNNPTDLQFFYDQVSHLCTGNLNKVRFVQVRHRIEKNGDLAALLDLNAPYFQILHGILFKNNLLTVVVPPGWQRGVSYNTPTLMNGFYDLNHNLMGVEGRYLLRVLGQTYEELGSSGFGILWNGNGAIASRTVDNISYSEINDFLKIYLNDLGASPEKFITFGGSRGGMTALNLASHPNVTAMKVALAYAAAPAYRLQHVAEMISPTIPFLPYAADWSIGLIGSWKSKFRHPSGYTNRTAFAGLDSNKAHLKVLTGSHDPALMESDFNLLTPRKISKLKSNKTQIYLEVSTHDHIVPSIDQFKLYKDAIANDLDVEVRINYLLGHWSDHQARDQKLLVAYKALMTQDYTPRLRFITADLVQSYIGQADGSTVKMASASAPLTVELPRFMVDEARSIITATGPRNGRYLMLFKKGEKNIIHALPLDGEGLALAQMKTNLFVEPGDYRLVGTYRLGVFGTPQAKVKFIATNKPEYPLVVTRHIGEIPPDILPVFSGALLEAIHGARGEKSYFNPGVVHGSNYGFLAVGEEPIPQEELDLIAPTAPKPAQMSCSVTSGTLANFSMSGKIIPDSTHFNKTGHYFVTGHDVLRNEWYSFDGTNWVKLDATNSNLLSIPGNPFTSAGISGSIFNQMNLSAYPGGKIYLGYGLNPDKNLAYSEMNQSGRKQLCTVLPNQITLARYTCTVTNNKLSSFSMSATIKPLSTLQGQPGRYFIRGKVGNDWYYFNGSIWTKYDGNDNTFHDIQGVTTLTTDGLSKVVFSNTDLTAYAGGEIHIGYGAGATKAEAWQDLVNNVSYKKCATLPSQ